eukprot:21228-Eustigmatos_ZCMA.PRE.1
MVPDLVGHFKCLLNEMGPLCDADGDALVRTPCHSCFIGVGRQADAAASTGMPGRVLRGRVIDDVA